MNGEQLRQDRINKGYSQREYSAKIGVSERTLRYWESGDIEIDPMKQEYVTKQAKRVKKSRK